MFLETSKCNYNFDNVINIFPITRHNLFKTSEIFFLFALPSQHGLPLDTTAVRAVGIPSLRVSHIAALHSHRNRLKSKIMYNINNVITN